MCSLSDHGPHRWPQLRAVKRLWSSSWPVGPDWGIQKGAGRCSHTHHWSWLSQGMPGGSEWHRGVNSAERVLMDDGRWKGTNRYILSFLSPVAGSVTWFLRPIRECCIGCKGVTGLVRPSCLRCPPFLTSFPFLPVTHESVPLPWNISTVSFALALFTREPQLKPDHLPEIPRTIELQLAGALKITSSNPAHFMGQEAEAQMAQLFE